MPNPQRVNFPLAVCFVLLLGPWSCSEHERTTGPVAPDTLCACVNSDTLCCPWLEYTVERQEGWPELSPDGRHVAFSRFSLLGAGIWLAEIDGSDERFLTSGDQPAWSPDGSEILFLRDFDVYVLSLSDSSVTRLTHNGKSLYPRWSPDGSRIAFTCGYSGEICMVDRDGANGTSLDIQGGMADWSPDGARFVFVGEPAGEGYNDVWIVGTDGRNRRRVSSGQWPWVEDPRWSPDGRKIVFTAPEWGDAQKHTAVWLIGPDGGGACRLTFGRAAEPSWSPDGSSIVYSRNLQGRLAGGCTWTIWLIELESCEARQITFPPATPKQADTWSGPLPDFRGTQQGLLRNRVARKRGLSRRSVGGTTGRLERSRVRYRGFFNSPTGY